MAAKPKPEAQEESQPQGDSLVITVSQLAQLSEKEKTAFRASGGTVTNDPQ
jgi:hypothetical protein